MRKVKWGVLGVAKIAIEKVIPAMQQGEASHIAAIASRDLGKARAAADKLGSERACGTVLKAYPLSIHSPSECGR